MENGMNRVARFAGVAAALVFTAALIGFGAAFLPVVFGIAWRLLASRQAKRAKTPEDMVKNR